jgi:hypothetical protein
MAALALDELRALFTGVPAENNEWSTAPSYTVQLAFEIAKRCDSQTELALRSILYDETPCDDIPARALEAIQLAVQRYRAYRDLQIGRCGL